MTDHRHILLAQFGAFCASEGATRLTHVFAAVVAARYLSPSELGLAALAIAVSEMVKAMANGGLGPQLIAVDGKELAAHARTCQRLAYWTCFGAAGIQCVLGLLLAHWMDAPILAPLLASLALVYPIMAPGLVSCFLIMREGRLAKTAEISATQMVTDNLLTIVLLLLWPSVWALVIPKLLVAPVWLARTRSARPWRADQTVPPAPSWPLLRFGAHVAMAELAATARLQGDKLLLGLILGADALGVYVFAFNAGLGISLALCGAFSLIAYPKLCRSEVPARELPALIGLGLVVIAPLTLLQSLGAPLYVPLLFGEHWREAAPLIGVLCLAAPARLMGGISQQFLRATHRTDSDAAWAWGSTILTLGTVVAAAMAGSVGGAIHVYTFITWVCDGLLCAFVLGSLSQTTRPSARSTPCKP
ncbi:MAG: oligosaccharide flippase family protein [Pseudomonadota bacterium]